MKHLFNLLIILIFSQSVTGASLWVDKYNVIWNSPSETAAGSMPLGNGDIGLNVWVEPSGDLLIYIGKTDAFDENSILQKVGRVRLSLSPRPIIDTVSFSQQLRLSTAEILIQYNTKLSIRVWVDANNPIVNIESVGTDRFVQTLSLETWRNAITSFKDTQVSDLFKNITGPDLYPTYIYPDTIVSEKNQISWFHSNCKPERDGYMETLRIQGMASVAHQFQHPLYQRVYGGHIRGDHYVLNEAKQLVSEKPLSRHHLQMACLTLHPSSGKKWSDSIQTLQEEYRSVKLSKRKALHAQWWNTFWNNSYVELSSTLSSEAEAVYCLSRAYNLSRFMNACGGRGKLPIKFNGSIFSYGKPDNPDYRRWGGTGFWFQNQRHIYYPMYAQGDFELMKPFFQLYQDILPLSRIRTKRLLGHEGTFFPETIFFWGIEVSSHYGWTPVEERKNPLAECSYLTYYFQNGIEMTSMMLDYWEYTKDSLFMRNTLLPHAQEVMLFYDKHYQLDNSGKILFAPAAALETYHIAINPLPEIAGLHYVIPKLLNLPADNLPVDFVRRCKALIKQLPDIPVQTIDGKRQLVPADSWEMKMNFENPELYAVFPYRLFGDRKPEVELALHAYQNRVFKQDFCWHQDVIDAVLLGLKKEAKEMILQRAMKSNYSENRFPAFWNSGWDWTPDVDHGGVMQNALNLMLLQCEGEEIRILPCFPDHWNVRFKLHAPNRTTVECDYKDGKINRYLLTPLDHRTHVTLH